MNTNEIMSRLQAKYGNEKEYLQAVREVLETVEDVYNRHPEFEAAKIVERIVEPDRIFTFKVTWVDDNGDIQVNTGYRVQFNSAIGPYKGGLRFHPEVPRIRADIQECPHHPAYGRWQRRLGLQPERQVGCRDNAFLPGFHA